MKILRKLAVILTVAALALSLAACGDTKWICNVDGETIPAGLYIYYQTEGYGDAVAALAKENEQYYNHYLYYVYAGYVDTSLFSVALGNGTVEDHINQYALDMCKQYVVTERLFNELGLEISDSDKDAIDNQVRNMWANNSEALENVGISESSIRLACTAKVMDAKVFDAYYEIGGLNGTTEEEVESYFADNYARIKYMSFQFADNIEDAIDETRKNTQLDLANSYLDRANAGESMDDLITEYNEYLAKQSETEDDTDSDAGTETEAEPEETASDESTTSDENIDAEDTEDAEDAVADEYPNEVIVAKTSTYPTEKFVSYVFSSCPVGEYTLIQDDTTIYLVQRLDILERDGLYEDSRDTIMSELFDDDYTSLLNERLKGYTVEVNDASVRRYKTEKAFPQQ